MAGVPPAEVPSIPVGMAFLFVPLHVLYSAYTTGLTEVVLQANLDVAAGTPANGAAADPGSQEQVAAMVGQAFCLTIAIGVLYSAYITGLTEVVLQANQNGAAGTPANGAAADPGSPGPDASGSTSQDERLYSASGDHGTRRMSRVGLHPGH
jgi:phage tail protein X